MSEGRNLNWQASRSGRTSKDEPDPSSHQALSVHSAQPLHPAPSLHPAPTLHPAWLCLIRFCSDLGHGELERLKIQDGLPVIAEVTTRKVKFSP